MWAYYRLDMHASAGCADGSFCGGGLGRHGCWLMVEYGELARLIVGFRGKEDEFNG